MTMSDPIPGLSYEAISESKGYRVRPVVRAELMKKSAGVGLHRVL
jgi:hypothetical protein